MNLKKFKPGSFAAYLFVAILYPVYAYVSTPGNALLAFIDSMTIMGFVFLIMGIIYTLFRHGDFDISEYVAKRSLQKGNIKPFKAFREDKNEERESKCNYPLLAGITLLIFSVLLATFVY